MCQSLLKKNLTEVGKVEIRPVKLKQKVFLFSEYWLTMSSFQTTIKLEYKYEKSFLFLRVTKNNTIFKDCSVVFKTSNCIHLNRKQLQQPIYVNS